MSTESLIDTMESDPTDVRGRSQEIRDALKQAQSREDLTEVYKRAVHLILMTHSSPLVENDKDMKRRRKAAEREFTRTVRMINKQAKKIGVEPDYSEDWENLATNGYETEDKNILEAQSQVGIVKE
jgi:glycyl-tRNA synthetase beta subunit